MTTWMPITQQEITEKISANELNMNDSVLRLWKLIRLSSPEKWQQHPWGDKGGGFWVVAVFGNRCLYYNDIEDGFNTSSFKSWGFIDHYYCNQDELHHVLYQLMCNFSESIVWD